MTLREWKPETDLSKEETFLIAEHAAHIAEQKVSELNNQLSQMVRLNYFLALALLIAVIMWAREFFLSL